MGMPPRGRARRLALGLVYLGTAGLIAATILAELGDHWWIADLFAHLRFQYIVAALALSALGLAIRARRAAALAAALIVPQLVVIDAVPAASLAAADSGSQPIRVITANIQWRNRNLDALLAHFRAAGADVIAFQEITLAARPLIRGLQKDYPHIAPADWEERSVGVLILSRHRIEMTKHDMVAGAPIVEATVRHPAKTFRFVAVHAPYPVSAGLYERHSRYFSGWLQQAGQSNAPLIVAGDFNLTPWSPRFRAAWRQNGLAFAGDYRLWPRTWPAHAVPIQYFPALLLGGIPIDHVLVSRHFTVLDARRGPFVNSDHYPYMVELRALP